MAPLGSSTWIYSDTGGPLRSDPLFHPLLTEFEDIAQMEIDAGIDPGLPIVLHPTPSTDDDRMEPITFAFFRSLTWTQMTKGTQRAYLNPLRQFMRHMGDRGLFWWQADANDLAHWKNRRTDDPTSPHYVSGATWNKEVAALNILFDWAANPARGYMPTNPLHEFPRGGLKNNPNGRRKATPEEARRDGVEWKMKNARAYRAKFIAPEFYMKWRDVSFRHHTLIPTGRGRTALGPIDEGHRGRNEDRNTAIADLLYLTGLRREECCSLLTCEISRQDTGAALTEWTVIGKGFKSRLILEPRPAAQGIHKYMRGERQRAIERGRRKGAYSDGNWLLVDKIQSIKGHTSIRFGESQKWMSIERQEMDADFRRRLLLVTEDGEVEPLALWLDEQGRPLKLRAFDFTFERANERFAKQCRAAGVDVVSVNPHALRSSYALMFLHTYIKAMDDTAGESEGFDRMHYNQAFMAVQEQLGHSSVTTTLGHYLEPVKSMLAMDSFVRAGTDIGEAFAAVGARIDTSLPSQNFQLTF
jgi:site-specific recombinase XerD